MSDIILQNSSFRLVIGADCSVKSLQALHSKEELIPSGTRTALFAATQERPYNNEIKLSYMNQETTLQATSARLQDGRLYVGFGLFPFEAVIDVTIKERYIAFTLADFAAEAESYPQPMDYPPVSAFTLLQLPFSASLTYGSWLNVCHGEKAAGAVLAASPHTLVDATVQGDIRILTAKVYRGIKLRGGTAVLTVSDKEQLLDAVEQVEEDFCLPRGVQSRKNPLINASAYWTRNLCPANVDAHIALAKQGGFSLMLLYYTCMTDAKGKSGIFSKCGDYSYNQSYPNGEADLRTVLQKLKAAGITPGFHFLHTHIGVDTAYVTPTADRRLHLTRRFTLSRALDKADTVIYVDEPPTDCPTGDPKSRLLRFDGEIICYERYTTEYPYCFVGCKRGHFATTVTPHDAYTVGGVLDVSEYTGSSIYLEQNSDLQEEIAQKIAAIYDLGFAFIYFDGSEGTNAPFAYHIPNAQHRVYKMLKNAPIFCEGAAKAHFGWHMLSGGNAFDIFPAEVFKQMILVHPFAEAKRMKADLTRVNFGWWSFGKDTRVDLFEFGTSKAAALDCPATVMVDDPALVMAHPRRNDILEMMRRWEEVRRKGVLTAADKQPLADPAYEHTLVKEADGSCKILTYYPVGEGCVGLPREIGKEKPHFSSMRAFVMLHKGDACAVIWDDFGESSLVLKTDKVLSYTREIESAPLPYESKAGEVCFTVSDRAYLRTACSLEELAALLQAALQP